MSFGSGPSKSQWVLVGLGLLNTSQIVVIANAVMSACGTLSGHAATSELSPLFRQERKSNFGDCQVARLGRLEGPVRSEGEDAAGI